jgi:hypothetical protein
VKSAAKSPSPRCNTCGPPRRAGGGGGGEVSEVGPSPGGGGGGATGPGKIGHQHFPRKPMVETWLRVSILPMKKRNLNEFDHFIMLAREIGCFLYSLHEEMFHNCMMFHKFNQPLEFTLKMLPG